LQLQHFDGPLAVGFHYNPIVILIKNMSFLVLNKLTDETQLDMAIYRDASGIESITILSQKLKKSEMHSPLRRQSSYNRIKSFQ
jgi:hypothetical protein